MLLLLLVITNGIDVPLIGAQEKGQNSDVGRALLLLPCRFLPPPLKLAASVIG